MNRNLLLKAALIPLIAISWHLYPQAMQSPKADDSAPPAAKDTSTAAGKTATRPSLSSAGSSWTAGGAAFQSGAQKGGIWQARSSSAVDSSAVGSTTNPAQMPGSTSSVVRVPSHTESEPSSLVRKQTTTQAVLPGHSTPGATKTSPGTPFARGNFDKNGASGVRATKSLTTKFQPRQGPVFPSTHHERRHRTSAFAPRTTHTPSSKARSDRSTPSESGHTPEPKENDTNETKVPKPRERP